MCYRCFWPKAQCWCPSIQPMDTRTRFVFLMHPKEFKTEKANTGRLTHLCLPNSKIYMGAEFDSHEEVRELLRDPRYYPVLVYPGPAAVNLSQPQTALSTETLGGRTLLVLLLDATWAGARKMLRLSTSLQRLPRVMFTPTTPSRYVIKQQPQEGCLSTLETVHELLLALERAGLDTYSKPDQLLTLFQRMQDFQIRCANDPSLPSYRKKPYGDPKTRTVSKRRVYIKQERDPTARP
ncbi:tRNA-uridine aminocarboxypropyltransferase [Ereboglobus luteus]|nr:tRNA-uridine aminocarboxypropyltransferase [Ereboglobus luteus]